MSVHPSKVLLFKRSNGFHYILYTVDGRKRWKSTGVARRSDALKVLAEFQDLLKTKPNFATLSSFVKDFLSYAETSYAPRTVIIYRQALGHLQRLAGDCSLSSVNARHFDRYKTERLTSIGPVGVNIELRALKAAMNIAKRWQLVEANPFAEGEQARVAEEQPVFFSRSDLEALLKVIKQDWLKELIVFAVSTGLRQGETVNLRWQDVDLQRGLIHVQSSPTFKTKCGKMRTIPMNKIVHEFLVRKSKSPATEYVFARKNRRIGESYLTHQFKRAIREAKLDERLHWHSLRHTHASWLVQNGVSLYEVQRLLGHSSSRVTEVYSHLLPEHLHDSVNKISVLMN